MLTALTAREGGILQLTVDLTQQAELILKLGFSRPVAVSQQVQFPQQFTAPTAVAICETSPLLQKNYTTLRVICTLLWLPTSHAGR